MLHLYLKPNCCLLIKGLIDWLLSVNQNCNSRSSIDS